MRVLTKELLSEILNINPKDGWYIQDFEIRVNNYLIDIGNIDGNIDNENINIHELAHNAKKKVLNYGNYHIQSGTMKDGGYATVIGRGGLTEYFSGKKENEIIAIFECFKWVLDNKE